MFFPPVIKALLAAGPEAVIEMRARIGSVRLGPIEDGEETFFFTLDGVEYRGVQRGRNRDCVLGLNEQADRGIALRVFLDGAAVKVTTDRRVVECDKMDA